MADAVKVELDLAATSALERQIANGAPCDVFVAAAPGAVDRLVQQGLLDGMTKKTIGVNSLVIVGAAGTSWTLETLAESDHVAVGAKGVPVGDYAREALERAGLLAKLESKLASYPDEPSVLAAVQNGGAKAGFVYASSVHGQSGLAPPVAVKPELHSKIEYVAAVARSSKDARLARAFVDGFRSPQWQAKLRDAGFIVPKGR
jgi:molybdate transport system substrate-binding protein